MIATVVSGFVPARRATRIEPVAAMRESVTPGPGRLRRRRIVVAARGRGDRRRARCSTACSATRAPPSATATVLGLGSLLMIFGFALLAPTLVRPLSGLIGRPLARFQGLTGRLARENTRRQPQRTAVTASALMIGVALVVLVAIFAAGLRATIDQGIDEQVKAVGHRHPRGRLLAAARRASPSASSRSTASPPSRGSASPPAAWPARPATRR